uniref:Uncharacterized protein n=1 Tax=Rhizophora mucronata TaxID=61149 RepID=A0A2P2NA11_RHIMU
MECNVRQLLWEPLSCYYGIDVVVDLIGYLSMVWVSWNMVSCKKEWKMQM